VVHARSLVAQRVNEMGVTGMSAEHVKNIELALSYMRDANIRGRDMFLPIVPSRQTTARGQRALNTRPGEQTDPRVAAPGLRHSE
jgi:hypothetical protein